jgi:hypothetical protein
MDIHDAAVLPNLSLAFRAAKNSCAINSIVGHVGLAALVPPRRVHLRSYHGVFSPDSRLRPRITPIGRGSSSGLTRVSAQRSAFFLAEHFRGRLGVT